MKHARGLKVAAEAEAVVAATAAAVVVAAEAAEVMAVVVEVVAAADVTVVVAVTVAVAASTKKYSPLHSAPGHRLAWIAQSVFEKVSSAQAALTFFFLPHPACKRSSVQGLRFSAG